MKTTFTKILCLLLAAVMLLSTAPGVFAREDRLPGDVPRSARIRRSRFAFQRRDFYSNSRNVRRSDFVKNAKIKLKQIREGSVFGPSRRFVCHVLFQNIDPVRFYAFAVVFQHRAPVIVCRVYFHEQFSAEHFSGKHARISAEL